MDNVLTAPDRTDLRRCEKAIEVGIKGVGESLLEIRDKRLWREKHKSFEHYCEDKWGFKKSYAYQLCQTGKARSHLSTIVEKTELPEKESHLREIAKAPEEKQVEVLERAREIAAMAEREPVAEDFKAARSEVVEEPEPTIEPSPNDQAESLKDKAIRFCKRDLPTVEKFRANAFETELFTEKQLKVFSEMIARVKKA